MRKRDGGRERAKEEKTKGKRGGRNEGESTRHITGLPTLPISRDSPDLQHTISATVNAPGSPVFRCATHGNSRIVSHSWSRMRLCGAVFSVSVC